MASRDKRSIAQPTVVSSQVSSAAEEPAAEPSVAEAIPPTVATPTATDAVGVAATLVAIEGDLQGEAFILRNGDNHLGRGSTCSPVLNSRWISRSHAHIECDQGRFLLRAAEGKDVYVNESLISEDSLQDGDRIRLGTTVFMLRMVTGTGEMGGSAIPVITEGTGSTSVGAAPAPVVEDAEEQTGEKATPDAPATGRRKRPFWLFWQKPVPSLVFTKGPRAGERIDLDRPRVRIGGLNDNDIVIHGHDASRNHAELRIRSGRAHIWDLRSVNGTWVNEQRIENVELKFGDVIRIGSEEFRFED